MKICGIICEYNPFHNGHLYHIEQTKKQGNFDAIICLMSGNFVQRGEPAILDKFMRARHAITAGADIVLELPTIHALASAEVFANGAIKILSSIPSVTHLSFGSECGDLETLKLIANVLATEPLAYKKAIEENLKKGCSLKNSKTSAMLSFFKEQTKDDELLTIAEVITAPNNILALEYLKALKHADSKIIPLTTKREGASYHSNILEGEFSSATSIRNLIINDNIAEIQQCVPQYVFSDILKLSKTNKIKNDLLGELITYKIRSMPLEAIEELYDVNEGLHNRIKTHANFATTFDSFIESIKSKRYTHARLKRIFLYAILGITKKIAQKTFKADPYSKVLAIKNGRQNLLSELSKGKLNLLCRKEDYNRTKNTPNELSIGIDLLASDIYALLNTDASLRLGGQDLTTAMQII